MMRPSVLLFDCDPEMNMIIREQIPSQEFRVVDCSKAEDAKKHLSADSFDLFLLNEKMPEISFEDFLKATEQLKSLTKLGVIAMTQNETGQHREDLLNRGISEVLVMPFDRGTLLSKLRAVVKKIKPETGSLPPQSGKCKVGEITLDRKSYDVFCGADRVHLTPSEFKLLQILMESPGKVFSREELIGLVQGEGISVVDRAVDTHIFSLRKKLGAFGDWIETVRGSGYRVKLA